LSLEVGAEVREALERGAPVVALESTLISHGLPHPQNLEVAREAERAVRAEGAVPATIGVVGGVAKAGLDGAELELMATAEDIPKLSARDLPVAVAKGSHGATTVAATAHLAALAGIRLFATGGLGGVHRKARESWDVSADLAALAATPVAVICSGVKSILDVPATLEIQNLPALGLQDSGLVVANPLAEEEQLDPALHERALRTSLEEMERRGLRGGEVTPFLLDRFASETKGESLLVNRLIILRNARLAARIAVALSALEGRP
jgi:pseudouridine-5'-phosphate glycosidase